MENLHDAFDQDEGDQAPSHHSELAPQGTGAYFPNQEKKQGDPENDRCYVKFPHVL
jgi:hypothetical protein